MTMTMPSHLAKRAISSSQYHYLALVNHFLRSHLSTGAQPQKDLPFIAQYLISSFDFSPDRALKYSAYNNLAPIKSPARPEAVVKFLSETGLSDTQIKAVVSFHPLLLGRSVDKTLKPTVRALMHAGCSEEILVDLIRYCPGALYMNNTPSRFQFWRDFVGKDDQTLLEIIQRNPLLLVTDIDNKIAPNLNLLKEYGLSHSDIVSLLQRRTRCMIQSLDSLREKLELIEELGIPRGCVMFIFGLKGVGSFSNDMIRRKVEYFKKTYGWSQEDVMSAFRKLPQLFACSEDKVKSHMDFLLGKAGFEARSIALQPRLLGCSLEKVLIPRYTVLRTLKANGLKIKCSLSSACILPERRFFERYVVSYETDVPGLGEAYASAHGGVVPV